MDFTGKHVVVTGAGNGIGHLLECVDIMDATGSRDLKLWFADGTNYPGQGDLRARQEWLAEGLAEIYARLGDHQRLVAGVALALEARH